MNNLSRRQFMTGAASVAAGVALSGCSGTAWFESSIDFDPFPDEVSAQAWRILNRMTFGPRTEERDQVSAEGIEAYVEAQLAPEMIDEDTRSMLKLRRLESLHVDHSMIFDLPEKMVTRELQQATLLRAIYSRRQLYEVMVNFWSDHFNISQQKDDCAWLKTLDDRDVIRPHALGKFRDLLHASAQSPAMLVYLDNQENHAGNPNENYARELMELHTLGVDGGYTQHDVEELGRCLTGWTVSDRFYRRGRFMFDSDIHDDGAKQIFGLTIPAGIQQAGGERVLDMLAAHPTTAKFIATKLVRRFVSDDPPPALVARTAEVFLKTEGDIKAVLRTILLSQELMAPRMPTRKLKRPFTFIASTLRQLNAHTDGGEPLLRFLSQMGQPLFQWSTPDGFPDYAAAWQGSLLTRWRFALALVYGEIEGTTLEWGQEGIDGRGSMGVAEAVTQFGQLLLGQALPKPVQERLLASHRFNEQVLLAALIGSPAFQWRM